MSGLPDEAVEAMANAFRVLPAHENREDWARRVLAALPAGVYVSDGQGKVEAHTEDEAVEAIARERWESAFGSPAWREVRHASWDRMNDAERFPWVTSARCSLAALSATDTEKADA